MATFHKIYGPARPGIASRAKLPPLVQGSRDTLYLAWLNLDGTPFDLSGASAITATFYREHAASTVYAADGTFAVTSAADGQLTWALGAGDVGQAGTFYFFIEAVMGGLPVVAGPVQVEVVANPEATAVIPDTLVGVAPAEAAYLTALVATVADATNVLSAANNLSDLDDVATARANLGVSSSLEIYGGIHVHDNTVAQSIPAGATYTKLTAFADNDPSAGLTTDVVNDKITLLTAGRYQVVGTFSFTAGTNNVTVFVSPFIDGVETDSVHFTRKIGTGADVGAATFSGIIDVTAVPVDVDVRLRHDSASPVNVTLRYANLNLHYLGSGA